MVAAIAVVSGTSATAQQAHPQMDVSGWMAAVERHRPGTLDEHARTVAAVAWPTLKPILEEVMRKGEPVGLLRGSALLLDVANHVPHDQRPQESGAGLAVLAEDGAKRGTSSLDSHIRWGRRLVDRTLADPRAPDQAEMLAHAIAWYRTVAAVLASKNHLADLEPHVEQSLRRFPDEAGVLFDAGCYAEALASPAMQAAMANPVKTNPATSIPSNCCSVTYAHAQCSLRHRGRLPFTIGSPRLTHSS